MPRISRHYQLPVCVDPSNPQQEDYDGAQQFLRALLRRDRTARWEWSSVTGYEDCLLLSTTLRCPVMTALCELHGSAPMVRWLALRGQFRRPDAGLYELQRVLLELQAEGKVRCCGTDHDACTLETLDQCTWIKPLALTAPIHAQIRQWAQAAHVA